MTDYRSSYRKTAFLAAVLAMFLLLICILLLSGALFSTKFLSIPLALICLAGGALSALIALGGMIGLRRDSLERAGKPYFTFRPRERPAGFVTRLRRRVLNVLSNSRSRLDLRPGEWVRIRPLSEIEATLDENGRLGGLPFMPEMAAYCGMRFPVFRRIEKFHDYFTPGGTGMRRVRDAVALGQIRCGGEAHGGCQASCPFVWKEAWLEPAKESAAKELPLAIQAPQLQAFACRRTPEGEPVYSCQLTELPKTGPLMWWNDPRHYLRDFWKGNIRLIPFVKVVALALFNIVQTKTRGPTAPYHEMGTPHAGNAPPPLNLQVGEKVRIKSKQEIVKTLKSSRNRGLWFDVELQRFCGGEFRVAKRVETIVDEPTGRMRTMKNPCIVLEGVSATGEYRGLFPANDLIFWREVWLERVGPKPEAAPEPSGPDARAEPSPVPPDNFARSLSIQWERGADDLVESLEPVGRKASKVAKQIETSSLISAGPSRR